MKYSIAALLIVGAMSTAQAQAPAAVMDRAVKRYTDMTSMSADFRQTISNPLTGMTSVSRGVLLRKDPNLLSITFSDPKGDRIVSDGKALWVYLPSSTPGQVIKMPAGTNGSMGMVDPGGLFLSSPSSRYTISGGANATVSGRKTIVIDLVPKRANNAFSKAKVWVDAADYSIRQFEVVDANGLTRRVTISNVKSDTSIGASAFRFAAPKGVRVIDGMSGG
jgi:outer membrane lipoprotein carrier protein